MIRYCYRRILLAVPVMIGISLLAFVLGLLSPGDPAEFAENAMEADGVYFILMGEETVSGQAAAGAAALAICSTLEEKGEVLQLCHFTNSDT